MSVTLNQGLVTRSSLNRKVDSVLEAKEHLFVKKGDLVYNMMRMWQGASGRAHADGMVSPAYVVLAPKDGIDSGFAAYWFKTPRMVHRFWAYSHGITLDRLRLYFNDFAQIPVMLPSLKHQKRIVAVLETWDRYLEKLAKKIEIKKRIRKQIKRQLVTGKKRLKSFRERWKQMRLGDVGPIVSGGTPSKKIMEYWHGNIPWISSSDLTEDDIKNLKVTRYINKDALNHSATNLIPRHSVVLVSRVGVGKLIVNEVDLCTSQDFQSLIIKDTKKFNCHFLAYLLSVKTNEFLVKNQGTSIKGFLKNDLRNLSILAPSFEEQKAIANILVTADKEIEGLEEKRKILDEQKKFLLNALISGDIRTPEDMISCPRKSDN